MLEGVILFELRIGRITGRVKCGEFIIVLVNWLFGFSGLEESLRVVGELRGLLGVGGRGCFKVVVIIVVFVISWFWSYLVGLGIGNWFV